MNRFLKPGLREFAPYVPGQQPPDGEQWVKLNTNESPYPPSPKVIEAVKAAVDGSLRLYPSPMATPARAAIAARFGLEIDQVALGNGCDELLAMCFRAFVSSGQAVAFTTPTYPILQPLAGIYEVEARVHPLGPGWALPESLVGDTAQLKFIVNPNSPTGTLYRRADIETIVRQAAGVVVLDETYADFAPESRLDLLAEYDNVLILRTMSKSFALCGMRIGFALGSPELIAALDMVKDSYNVNRLSIVAAVAAIQDRTYHRELVHQIIESRTWLAERLGDLGFTVEPSATNFLFVQPPHGRAAPEVAAALKERRILVRHYDRPPIDGWLRITVGSPVELEALVGALGEILQVHA